MVKINLESLEVLHNLADTRFEIQLDGQLAVLEYHLNGTTMIITHTYVPPRFEGQGIANKLANTALEYAKEENYKIISFCSFVDVYLRRHPEYQVLLKYQDRTRDTK